MDLRNIDLNLLVALDVLLEEQHITNSATRLNFSQPAMSRVLGRLRDTFNDPILVRISGGYERTARAESLIAPLKEILAKIRGTLVEPIFDPATTTETFTISTLDYGESVVVPSFTDMIARKAPNAKINILSRTFYSVDEIMDGEAGIVFGSELSEVPKHCVVQPLYEDRIVCVMHKTHPLAKAQVTLQDYLEFPHSIIHTGEIPGSYIDDVLEQLGHTRKIVKRSPHFIASLMSITNTPLIQTVPERLAKSLVDIAGLVIKEMPFDVEPMKLVQMWHAKNNNNPSHLWFRKQIELAARV